MPRFYDNDPFRRTSEPRTAPETPETETEPAAGEIDGGTVVSYEEFDISSFDFSIADPGEDTEETPAVPTPGDTEPLPVSERESEGSSFKTISEKVSGKITGTFSGKSSGKIRQKGKRSDTDRADSPAKFPISKETLQLKGRRYLRYALRPSALYENIGEVLWPLFLGGASLFMGVVYLLIGLDWYNADLIATSRLWAFALVGLLVGASAALSFAGGVQIVSLIIRKEKIRPFRVLSSVAGAAVFPSALLILGLLIQLIFGAAVSMSFGVMAILWLVYILMEVLRDFFGNRFLPNLTFLTAWGFLLFTVMSLTFSLK